jgi:hypothetical protein
MDLRMRVQHVGSTRRLSPPDGVFVPVRLVPCGTAIYPPVGAWTHTGIDSKDVNIAHGTSIR